MKFFSSNQALENQAEEENEESSVSVSQNNSNYSNRSAKPRRKKIQKMSQMQEIPSDLPNFLQKISNTFFKVGRDALSKYISTASPTKSNTSDHLQKSLPPNPEPKVYATSKKSNPAFFFIENRHNPLEFNNNRDKQGKR